MKQSQSENKTEATLGFAAKFFLKLLGLMILFSIVPLLFVNLPLGMFLANFGNLYIPLILFSNLLAVFFSGAFATKLIFAWGVNGCVFKIRKEGEE